MEKLIPFAPIQDQLSVTADITLQGNFLDFRFELIDPKKIVLDTLGLGTWAKEEIARADLLWKTTCFEAFWAVPGEKSYWEINVAASGKNEFKSSKQCH